MSSKSSKKTSNKINNVYQFKITLRDAPLPIWRRIQVPATYTFWDLHIAIQDAMGWDDCHLHEFVINNPRTGEPEHIGVSGEDDCILPSVTKPGWQLKIGDYFTNGELKQTSNLNRQKHLKKVKIRAMYLYDFGDDWTHIVEFENIKEKDPHKTYPCCLDGIGACPPEDVGGVWGYEDFLAIINDPEHEDYEGMLQWAAIDESFDPSAFDPLKVVFDDPKERWKESYGQHK